MIRITQRFRTLVLASTLTFLTIIFSFYQLQPRGLLVTDDLGIVLLGAPHFRGTPDPSRPAAAAVAAAAAASPDTHPPSTPPPGFGGDDPTTITRPDQGPEPETHVASSAKGGGDTDGGTGPVQKEEKQDSATTATKVTPLDDTGSGGDDAPEAPEAGSNSTSAPPWGVYDPRAPLEDEWKYFHEKGGSWELSHYDERFFKGIVPPEIRQGVLSRLARSYLSFCEEKGLETWLAHGTLLAWWWNQKLFPWDSDIDVQVSIDTLLRLGYEFNQTTHAFVSADERGPLLPTAYFLDINPFIRQRVMGNGANRIDARWIDTSTGLYVDITGLAEADPDGRPGMVQCKNNHHYNKADIWPLRVSSFEGQMTRIPRMDVDVLRAEYGKDSMLMTEFHGYRWIAEDGVWIE